MLASTPSPQILHKGTNNYLKGGDFMERREIPSQAVTPEPESVVGLRNSRFPERVGRIKPTPEEIAATTDPDRPIDWSVFRSVSSMDAGGE